MRETVQGGSRSETVISHCGTAPLGAVEPTFAVTDISSNAGLLETALKNYIKGNINAARHEFLRNGAFRRRGAYLRGHASLQVTHYEQRLCRREQEFPVVNLRLPWRDLEMHGV